MELINLEQKATLGSGFGLCPDLALSTMIWATIQMIAWNVPIATDLKKEVKMDIRNRSVAIIHSVFVCLLSIRGVFFETIDPVAATNSL
jgi:cytochrome oxidase Cu insertion factor (SCO1/SenC/PrrC family)